jgi:hypothetical protein
LLNGTERLIGLRARRQQKQDEKNPPPEKVED